MIQPSKILCVGRNYVAHAKELGGEVPDEPLVFMKPPSALIPSGAPIRLPPGVGRVDYEGEIAFRVGKTARHIDASEWRSYVSAVLPANDVTARDIQRRDDQWTRAKGFDTFCVLGPEVGVSDVELDDLTVVTRVNGEERQRGHVSEMAFPPGEILAYISGVMTLVPGDLVLTGTPEGVGPLHAGDRVEVEIPGVGLAESPVVDESP